MSGKQTNKKPTKITKASAAARRLPRGYATLLDELKTRVRAAQLTAVLSVNPTGTLAD